MSNARQITKTLGGRWWGAYGLVRCPAHDDREPSLSIRDGEHELIVNCFAGCDWQDVKAELKRQGLIDDWSVSTKSSFRSWESGQHQTYQTERNSADDLEQRVAFAMGIWSASISLPGTLGWRYFIERRGLHVGLLDDLGHCLRWHGGIAAVVALMTDPITNEPTGVHRTFISSDGARRERKMLGRQGVIRLSPDEEVTQGLGVGEGLEDGLAILLSGWAPVWAATSCGAIERFPVLSGIESLTVLVDDDEAGIAAAQSCAANWTAVGREARIAHPKDSYGT